MKRYMLLINPQKDLPLVLFCDDLNKLFLKYNCIALLNELVDPLIIDNKNNNNLGYE